MSYQQKNIDFRTQIHSCNQCPSVAPQHTILSSKHNFQGDHRSSWQHLVQDIDGTLTLDIKPTVVDQTSWHLLPRSHSQPRLPIHRSVVHSPQQTRQSGVWSRLSGWLSQTLEKPRAASRTSVSSPLVRFRVSESVDALRGCLSLALDMSPVSRNCFESASEFERKSR